MAVQHISINSTKRLGSELRQTVNYGTSFEQQLDKLKDIMDTMIDGTDYSRLETDFGLTTGKGETVYNLVAGSLTALRTGDLAGVIARLG
jgi:hypothetical protein